MPVYGPRDAASVLMDRGHKVALRYLAAAGPGGGWRWRIELDGLPVSLAELEDAAEGYERLKNRITARAARPAVARALRSVSVVTGLHR